MDFSINKLPKNVSEVVICVPWKKVKDTYEIMILEVISNAEIKGFRKGKAPRDLVEKNLNKEQFNEEIINKILPEVYQETLNKFNLKPVIYPRIEILSKNENEEWKIKLMVCEKPEVQLKSYKDELSSKKAKEKIWIPGQEEKPQEKPEDKNKKLSDNLAFLVQYCIVDVSDLLIEDEMTKLLSQLLEEVKKLGLSLDQYIASTHKTIESLRNEYKEKAEQSLKLEFIISAIADGENIVIGDAEIKEAIKDVADEKLKKELESSNYQLAGLLRRQKTLDFIANL